MIYLQLLRFLLPLVITLVLFDLTAPFLNGGMARVPRATETLAAYGLAWGWTGFLTSFLSQMRQVGLALGDSHRARRKIQGFVLVCGVLLAGVLALLALSPAGVWVADELHGVPEELGLVVRQALFWLIPIPALEGLNRLYSGLLLRARRTEVLSGATAASIGASIIAVFVLLKAPFIQEHPIRLPILVTYVRVLVDLGIVRWGYGRYVSPTLPERTGEELSIGYVLRFFWPLALVMGIQGLSRPAINLFVSRGPDGAEALAVLAVVYGLAHVPYGWVNELRSLPVAFRGEVDNLRQIRLFSGGCGLFSFGVMVALFWTPLRGYILETLIGLEAGLAGLCRTPLILFSFFPLTVMVRAYLHGVALLQHRTRALAPSGPSRIGIICVVLMVLPTALPGATRGVAALLSGFALETLVVWWGVRGVRRSFSR